MKLVTYSVLYTLHHTYPTPGAQHHLVSGQYMCETPGIIDVAILPYKFERDRCFQCERRLTSILALINDHKDLYEVDSVGDTFMIYRTRQTRL